MSIESFLSAYPAQTFVKEMAHRPDHGSKSPVIEMARIYRLEGSHGMKEATSKNLVPVYAPETAKTVADSSLYFNKYGVILSTTIEAIEEIIVNREFDQFVFNSRIQEAHVGSSIPYRTYAKPIVEYIPPRISHRMLEIAKNDLTFGSFFTTEFSALPESLNMYLSLHDTDYLRSRVLPDFVLRTQLLIDARKSQKA